MRRKYQGDDAITPNMWLHFSLLPNDGFEQYNTINLSNNQNKHSI